MAVTAERGLVWSISRGLLGQGARDALLHPAVSREATARIFPGMFFYDRLGTTKLQGHFTRVLPHPLFKDLIGDEGILDTTYRELFEPVNQLALEFIGTLPDRSARLRAYGQLAKMVTLTKIADTIPVVVGFGTIGEEHRLTRVEIDP